MAPSDPFDNCPPRPQPGPDAERRPEPPPAAARREDPREPPPRPQGGQPDDTYPQRPDRELVHEVAHVPISQFGIRRAYERALDKYAAWPGRAGDAHTIRRWAHQILSGDPDGNEPLESPEVR